jgi:N-acetylglucosamine-6-phosphate deacetylase
MVTDISEEPTASIMSAKIPENGVSTFLQTVVTSYRTTIVL